MERDPFVDETWVDLTRLGFAGWEATPMRLRTTNTAVEQPMYFHWIREIGTTWCRTYIEAPTAAGLWTELEQTIAALEDSERRRRIRRILCEPFTGPGPAYPA